MTQPCAAIGGGGFEANSAGDPIRDWPVSHARGQLCCWPGRLPTVEADPMKIEIVVFDGFDEIDAIGPFEVLSSAGFDVTLVGVEKADIVVSQRGVRLDVAAALGTPEGVIVPGGGWLDRAPEGRAVVPERGFDAGIAQELVQEVAEELTGRREAAGDQGAHELQHLLQNAVIETLSGRIVVTASVGVAATDGRRMGVVRLLARADVDMYRRKKRRKSSR